MSQSINFREAMHEIAPLARELMAVTGKYASHNMTTWHMLLALRLIRNCGVPSDMNRDDIQTLEAAIDRFFPYGTKFPYDVKITL